MFFCIFTPICYELTTERGLIVLIENSFKKLLKLEIKAVQILF